MDTLAIDRVKGSIDLAVVEGREPRRSGELLVGRKTLEALGVDVGDSVTARVGSRTARLKVVGVGVFPRFGDLGQFGSGALMTYGQLKEIVPAAKQNVFLLTFTPETSVATEYSHVRNALEPLPSRLAQRPSDLQNLSSIGGLQVALVTILGALAAATLAHTLLTSVRRRRKSIAILRTLGFARRQVSAVVVVQALTLVVIALALGTALGIVGWTSGLDPLRRQPRHRGHDDPALERDRGARRGRSGAGRRRGGHSRLGRVAHAGGGRPARPVADPTHIWRHAPTYTVGG